MKKNILWALCLCAVSALAQNEKPFFLPGEGVYLVGINKKLEPAVAEPAMVCAAYKATMLTENVELASIEANGKSYPISNLLSEDGSMLNLQTFMGVGKANGLIVRDMDGQSYQLGDYAPTKTWKTTHLWAAADLQSVTGHSRDLPLCMYDQWDCPITYEKDELQAASDYVTVQFSSPIEGLVVRRVSMALVVKGELPANADLAAEFTYYHSNRTITNYTQSIAATAYRTVRTEGENTIYYVSMPLKEEQVIDCPFDLTISGFDGLDAWLARAVDTHNLYPSHTFYQDGKQNVATDVCVNVVGYFNYVGTWSYINGKQEFGEVVKEGDYVQVYYDPSDPDWPGEYYTGEVTFPVECTFGIEDLTVKEQPAWIECNADMSQWEQYEAIQLIFSAQALPQEMEGRLGKVVISTKDGASEYTILIRQGSCFFDCEQDPTVEGAAFKESLPEKPNVDDIEDAEAIQSVVVLPTAGGRFDLLGRPVREPQAGQIIIENGALRMQH